MATVHQQQPRFNDPYGTNILAHDPHRDGPYARRPRSRDVHIELGMILEDVSSGFVGEVLRVEKSGGMHVMELEDRHGRRKTFPLGGGFWLEGQPINALAPLPATRRVPQQTGPQSVTGRKLTNSGSVAAPLDGPKVARQSRIWVEGKHDADLVQHVWGDDLAHVGVVVELLDGADNLEAVIDHFAPGQNIRAGVLLDHMVQGSKEWRIAQTVKQKWGDSVHIIGHPFIDIWQAVKPQRVGLSQWPDIPRGTDIKVGTLAALGWEYATQADIAMGWKRILSTVRHFQDVEPALLGRVEELIDFVTAPGTH